MNQESPPAENLPGRFAARWGLPGTLVLALAAAPALGNELPSLECVITPSRTVDLSTAVPGLVERVTVDRSDLVEEGQVVALLASKVEKAEVAIAGAKAGMTAEIRVWEVSVDHDQRNRQRLDSLHTRQAAAEAERDRAKRDADLSRWKLRRARDLHELSQLELVRAKNVLDQKTIRSPIAGVVVERFKSAGEYVEDQAIVRIARLDPLYVETILPMEFFGKVATGMVGEVVLEGHPDETFQASVTAVDRLGDAASGTFGVRLDLPNPDYALPAGLKCSVRLLPQPRLASASPAESTRPDAPAPMVAVSQSQASPPAQARPAAVAPDDVERIAEMVQLAAITPEPDSVPAEIVNSAPAERQADACLSIGPLNDAGKAERLVAMLETRGVTAGPRPIAVEVPNGYIVVSAGKNSSEDMRALRDSLSARGVRDFVLMSRGPFAGRLSFGVYNHKGPAERRSRQLARLGVGAEVAPRTRTEWWLELETQLPPNDAADLLDALGGSRPLSCRTALGGVMKS